MACELLVEDVDNRKSMKGCVVDCKPDGHVWSRQEQPPYYNHVRLTDASPEEGDQYLEKWRNTPVFTWSPPSQGKKNVNILMPAEVLNAYPDKGLDPAMPGVLERTWGAETQWIRMDAELSADVPEATDQAALESDMIDNFEEQIGPRYLFEPSMSSRLEPLFKTRQQPIELTTAQAISITRDRTKG